MLCCKDCKYFQSDGYCQYHRDVHDTHEVLCPNFTDEAGRSTVYGHIASDVRTLAKYLVHMGQVERVNGNIVYWSFGERKYASEEAAIDAALAELLSLRK